MQQVKRKPIIFLILIVSLFPAPAMHSIDRCYSFSTSISECFDKMCATFSGITPAVVAAGIIITTASSIVYYLLSKKKQEIAILEKDCKRHKYSLQRLREDRKHLASKVASLREGAKKEHGGSGVQKIEYDAMKMKYEELLSDNRCLRGRLGRSIGVQSVGVQTEDQVGSDPCDDIAEAKVKDEAWEDVFARCDSLKVAADMLTNQYSNLKSSIRDVFPLDRFGKWEKVLLNERRSKFCQKKKVLDAKYEQLYFLTAIFESASIDEAYEMIEIKYDRNHAQIQPCYVSSKTQYYGFLGLKQEDALKMSFGDFQQKVDYFCLFNQHNKAVECTVRSIRNVLGSSLAKQCYDAFIQGQEGVGQLLSQANNFNLETLKGQVGGMQASIVGDLEAIKSREDSL